MARTRLYPPSVDPGFPELPPTPDGWIRTTFGDLLDVVERPVRLNPSEQYRLVVAKRNRGGIALRREVLGREVLTKTQFEAKAGDFLISRRQIIHGACGVVPDELDGAVVSNEYATIRTRPGLLMEFLRHYCHSAYFQRTCFHSSHGVDVEKMIFKLRAWLARACDVPPVAEQKKIAAILSSVDEAIEATQAVVDQLQVVKQAMMGELLTKGIPGRHSRFKKTEIGEVPEGWGVVPIDQLGDIAYGLTVNAKRRNATERRSYLTVANLKDDGFDLSTVKDIGVLDGDVERYALQAGDILVVEGNANIDRLGRAMMWECQLDGALHQNHLIRIRPYIERIEPAWLALVLNSSASRQQIRDAAKTSSGLHTINSRVVADMRVPSPSADERRSILDAIGSVEARIEKESEALQVQRQVKSALLSVLLTGEVRVEKEEARCGA